MQCYIFDFVKIYDSVKIIAYYINTVPLKYNLESEPRSLGGKKMIHQSFYNDCCAITFSVFRERKTARVLDARISTNTFNLPEKWWDEEHLAMGYVETIPMVQFIYLNPNEQREILKKIREADDDCIGS